MKESCIVVNAIISFHVFHMKKENFLKHIKMLPIKSLVSFSRNNNSLIYIFINRVGV